jgi:hypothetical protein
MCNSAPNREEWNYRCFGLNFVVDVDHLSHYKRVIPGNLHELIIELNVTAEGICIDYFNSKADPFTALTVDCKIEGRKKKGQSFYYVWHLDRNIGDTEKESIHFAHPCYHFQVGGNYFPREYGYGRLLLLEPPRIAHPPLDATLAIDFVISNYFPNTWHELRKKSRYERIIREAQRQFWFPYAEAAFSGWSTNDVVWKASNIWPQLI